jgi:hypothetical protein
VPQVIRLSTTYALLDGSEVVEVPHLLAAFAVWDYVCASAWIVFGDVATNRELTKLMTAIDAAGRSGLTRSAVSEVFGRNKSSSVLDELLGQLTQTGHYEQVVDRGTGRGRTASIYRRSDERNEIQELTVAG